MRLLVGMRSLLRLLRHRPSFESNMDEELRFHIEEQAEEFLGQGMGREEALRRARLAMSDLNTVRKECRGSRGLLLPGRVYGQCRYALRLLRKSPAFTATALATIALCLGANLAIFAAVHSVLLRSLPFPKASRLVALYNTYPRAGVYRDGSSVANYYERRGGKIRAFRSASLYYAGSAILGNAGPPVRIPLLGVSPEFFSTVGIPLVAGRSFEEGEMDPGRDRVAIVSEDFRRSHWASTREALGAAIRIDGVDRRVVGIAPANFRFLSSPAELIIPASSSPERHRSTERHSGGNVMQMVARLNDGVSLSEAQAQIDAQNAALETNDPSAKEMAAAGFRTAVVSLHADHVAAVRPFLLSLQAGSVLLLLAGCLNLANLQLVRGAARVREVAVRRALGAGTGALAGELMTETTLLTLGGSALGLVLGWFGTQWLRSLGAERLPLGSGISFDGTAVAVAIGTALALSVLLGLPAALLPLRSDLQGALKSESRAGTISRPAQRLRYLLLAGQVAFAFVLLTCSALLGVSLKNALAVSPGFNASRSVTASISLVGDRYLNAQSGLLFTERAERELLRQPGVIAAGFATNIPFSGYSGKSAATVQGYVRHSSDSPHGHYSYGVAGDYFRAMGFSLKSGRFLDAADSRRHERVCVVDYDFARFYWPGRSALGQHLFPGSAAGPDSEAFTVVGVVAAVKQASLTDPERTGAVYFPFIYRPQNNLFVVVRGVASNLESSLERSLEDAIHRVDPGLAVTGKLPAQARIDASLEVRRSPAELGVLFSVIALLLTSVGTYGVVSYAAALRRREIGIRIALGARPSQIWGYFLGATVTWLTAGLLLGAGLLLLAAKAINSVLFGVHVMDPAALIACAAVVICLAVVACVAPLWRAGRLSPLETLSEN